MMTDGRICQLSEWRSKRRERGGDVQVSTGWEGKGERNQHFDDGMFALEEECVGIPTLCSSSSFYHPPLPLVRILPSSLTAMN